VKGCLLLNNARLVGAGGEPRAVLLERGLVRAVTAAGDVTGVSKEVDLDGRFLVRGLWDHHVHLDQWALARRRLDLSGCTSAAECVGLVRRRLGEEPTGRGQLLLGHGFRDGVWPDQPSLDALDAVAADVPVLLVSHDLHCAWLSSAAFAHFGIAVDASGLVREAAFHALLPRLGDVPTDVLDRWVSDATRAAAARGATGVVDFEMAANVDTWTRRILAGARSLRIDAVLYPEHVGDAVRRGLRTGDAVPGTRGLLEVGPVKVFLDGSLNSRTAHCHHPYPEVDGAGPHGLPLMGPDELTSVMREARAHGLRCAVHAIGDHANTVALDGFESSGARGSIEHAQLLRPADLPRFAALGVTASVQPGHALADRDVADRHWRGRTDRAFAYADLLRYGATLRFGSDAPVAPLDPWRTIAAAVHRSGDGRPAWHPEQQVTVAAALAASTQGRFTPRLADRADLVVTDLDPLAASADDLRTMPVSGTLLAGRWTWRADAFAEDVAPHSAQGEPLA
jgi:predicted amidohydrolase YtcJ